MPFFPWSRRHLSLFYALPKLFQSTKCPFDDLNSINSEILKMIENETVQVLLFVNKRFSKDMNFRIFTSSIRFIKDSKRFDESLSSWEKPFKYIFTTGIKIKKYYFTFCISVSCNLSAVKSSKVSFCVCIVLYIYIFIFFKFSVVCRCVCFDE